METLPRNAKIGCALGFIGGIIGIACLAFYFEPEESTITTMGVYMLISLMFFALAGGFTRSGQWSWDVLLMMTFLTIGVVCAAFIFNVIDLYVLVVLVLIGALIALNLSMPAAKTWVNRIRV